MTANSRENPKIPQLCAMASPGGHYILTFRAAFQYCTSAIVDETLALFHTVETGMMPEFARLAHVLDHVELRHRPF